MEDRSTGRTIDASECVLRPLRRFPNGIFARSAGDPGIPDLSQFRNLTFFWLSVVVFLIVLPIIFDNFE